MTGKSASSPVSHDRTDNPRRRRRRRSKTNCFGNRSGNRSRSRRRCRSGRRGRAKISKPSGSMGGPPGPRRGRPRESGRACGARRDRLPADRSEPRSTAPSRAAVPGRRTSVHECSYRILTRWFPAFEKKKNHIFHIAGVNTNLPDANDPGARFFVSIDDVIPDFADWYARNPTPPPHKT